MKEQSQKASDVEKCEDKVMKTIFRKAQVKLKKIKDEINAGDYKRRISETEIISDAIMRYQDDWIRELHESRKDGMDDLKIAFGQYKSQGGTDSLSDFIKNEILSVYNTSKKRRPKLAEGQRQ